MKCCEPGCVFPASVGPYCPHHLQMRADPLPFLQPHAKDDPEIFESEGDRNRRRCKEYARVKNRQPRLKEFKPARIGLEALTAKEFRFAQLLCEGLHVGIAAIKMGWTIDTARSYRSKLYFKAGMGLDAIRREIAGRRSRAA